MRKNEKEKKEMKRKERQTLLCDFEVLVVFGVCLMSDFDDYDDNSIINLIWLFKDDSGT
jgi:hypothetical protein